MRDDHRSAVILSLRALEARTADPCLVSEAHPSGEESVGPDLYGPSTTCPLPCSGLQKIREFEARPGGGPQDRRVRR